MIPLDSPILVSWEVVIMSAMPVTQMASGTATMTAAARWVVTAINWPLIVWKYTLEVQH